MGGGAHDGDREGHHQDVVPCGCVKMQTGGGGLAAAAQLGEGGVATAEAAMAASVAASGRVPQGPPQQRQRCPLCGDAKHSYKQGAYDHPADREITQSCPRVLSDGKACGLVHAFAGLLGTPCRGGLEGGRYRAPQ